MEIYRFKLTVIKEWREELKMPGLFVIRGVTDNEGRIRKDLDTLPYLPLALSDKYKVPIVIIKDNITKRVDHLAVFGGKVGINQRGEVYDYARVRETAGYCEVLKGAMSAKEARAYYKEVNIDHTTRETKKQVRQIVINRPLVLELQIKSGDEIRTLCVTDYLETGGKIIYKRVINGEVLKRDTGVPKGTLLGLQIKGLR